MHSQKSKKVKEVSNKETKKHRDEEFDSMRP